MKKTAVLSLLLLLIASVGSCAYEPLDEHIYLQGITYTGDYYEELCVPANAMATLTGEEPTESNCQSGFVYLLADYADAGDEPYVHFTFQLPHSYKEGTSITPNVRFIFNSDQVNTVVRWRMSYSWANIGDPFNVSLNTWANSTPSNNDGLNQQITEFTPWSGTGKEIGSTVMCYLQRNSSSVSDNYTDTVILVSAGILYQVDSPGSTGKWIK
jgi:hypothetical protein